MARFGNITSRMKNQSFDFDFFFQAVGKNYLSENRANSTRNAIYTRAYLHISLFSIFVHPFVYPNSKSRSQRGKIAFFSRCETKK